MNDQRLDRLIRSHDAADDPGQVRRRLDTRLADLPPVPATMPSPGTGTAPSGSQPGRRPRRSSGSRRALGLVAAAAAAGVALVLLPGPGQEDAYASWTATPQPVAEQDATVAVQECRDAIRGPFWNRRTGGPEEFDPVNATVALTERRGELVSLLLRDQGAMKDFSASCVVLLEEGAASGEVTSWGIAGSTGGAPSTAPPDGFLEGSMFQDGGADPISMVDGAVGANVAAITMHAGDITVEATIEEGRYAAWFPGRVFPDRDWGPSGEGGPVPMITYDITLTDGTVITDAEPSRP